jgi:hypothetical protein
VPAAGSSSDASKGGAGSLTTILTGLATGVGLLAWITFLGGAIIWIRAEKASLPASEVVAVTPKPVLLSLGAEFAALAAALGAIAVLAIFFRGAVLKWRGKLTGDAAEEKVRGLAEQIQQCRQSARDADQVVIQLDSLILRRREQNDVAGIESDEAMRAIYVSRANEARSKAAELEGEQATARTTAEQITTRERHLATWALGGFLIGVLVFFAIFWPMTVPDTAILIVVAIGLIGLSFVVLASERPVWFGVAVFVAVTIYTGVETYLRTSDTPTVEPAAALRTNAGPLCGFFVAETSDFLYLGTYARPVAVSSAAPSPNFAGGCTGPPKGTGVNVRTEGLPPRLITVPKAEITDLAIGHLVRLDDGSAATRSAAMALDLCLRRNTESKKAKSQDENGCSHRELRRLRTLVREGPITSPN